MFIDMLKDILGLDNLSDKEKVLQAQKLTAAQEAIELEHYRQLQQRFESIDLGSYIGGRPFGDEVTMDLSTPRTDVEIWNRPFKSLCITQLRHLVGANTPVAYIRFDEKTSSKYRVRPGYVRGHFRRLYLTNTAQANTSFQFVIGNTTQAAFRMFADTPSIVEEINALMGLATEKTLADLWTLLDGQPRQATAPTLYNVTMGSADTEYSQLLPTGTKIVNFHLTDYATFRYAWVTGKVATPTEPYWTVVANEMIERRGLYLSTKTLYFAESVGSKTMQIEVFV